MNTFSTVEELIQILDENPELLEALRSHILTQELLNLPQAHAEFVVEVREFIAATRDFMMTTNTNFQRLSDGLDRLSNDFGNFRGAYAESAARKSSIGIVMELSEDRGLGLDEITFRNLTQKDLAVMARKSGDISDLSRGELRSFYESDLVIEALDSDGEAHYIAVEASYTCDSRDTIRAITRARMIARFSSRPAHPTVAGVRKDYRIQADIGSGKVFWHQLDEGHLKP